MTPSQIPHGGRGDALPPYTTEEHPAGYDYVSRFPNARVIGAGEGGSILVADDASGAYVITDEGTLADFLEASTMSFVVICRFDSTAERDRYCELRYGPLIRNMEQWRNLW